MLTQPNASFPTVSLLDIGGDPETGGTGAEQVSRALEVMAVPVTLCGMLPLLARVQVSGCVSAIRSCGVAHVREPERNRCVPHLVRIRHAGVSCRAGRRVIGAETALAILQINVLISPEPDWRLWGAHCRLCKARCCFQYAAAGLACSFAERQKRYSASLAMIHDVE